MAQQQEITPNLGLVIDSNLTATAKQNLRKLDAALARSGLVIDDGVEVNTEGDIFLQPGIDSEDGGDVYIGTDEYPAGTIFMYGFELDLSNVSNVTGFTPTGITDESIAAGADIQQSKIQGLASSLAGKQDIFAAGELTSSSPTVITISDGAGKLVGGSASIAISPSSAVADGYLSSIDFSFFAAKEEAGVALGLVAGHELAYDHTDIEHTNRTDLDLVSGTNTGDEDTSSIKTKLGAASALADGYLTAADWSTFSGKQDSLGFTPVNKAGDTLTGQLVLDNLGLQFDTTGAAPSTPVKGQLWWDSDNETLAIKMAGTEVVQQVGQEMFVRALNNTAAIIPNGSVVYVSGASDGTPTIALARADVVATSDGVIGVATEDIAIDAVGHITTTGVVRNIKTDTDCNGAPLIIGELLYLCPAVAGGFTKTVSPAPYHQVKVGTVLKVGATDGIILVRIEIGQHLAELHDVLISGLADRDVFEYDAVAGVWKNYINPNTITLEPTGFADPANIVVTYDTTAGADARKLTISHPSGFIKYYINGMLYTRTSPYTSTAHTDAPGQYFFAFATGNIPTWSEAFPGFNDGTYVSVVQYGATDKFAIRECHGLMPWQAWQELHSIVGTYRDTANGGGAVTGLTQSSSPATLVEICPLVDNFLIHDEDLPTSGVGISDKTNAYTTVYINNNIATFAVAQDRPYLHDGANPQYNQNPVTGTALTTITNNGTWFNVYGILVPTARSGSYASPIDSPYRILWLTGQATYNSLTLAQAEDFRTLQLGNLTTLFAEFVPYIRISYQRQANNAVTSNTRLPTGASPVSYIAGSKLASVSVSGFVPTIHSTLAGRDVADSHPASAITNTPSGAITAIDVQSAINFLATKYTLSILPASWTGTGPYTLSISAATHLRGLDPIIQIRDLVSGTTFRVGLCDIDVDSSTGDVLLTSNEAFTGRLLIL